MNSVPVNYENFKKNANVFDKNTMQNKIKIKSPPGSISETKRKKDIKHKLNGYKSVSDIWDKNEHIKEHNQSFLPSLSSSLPPSALAS